MQKGKYNQAEKALYTYDPKDLEDGSMFIAGRDKNDNQVVLFKESIKEFPDRYAPSDL